MSTEDLYLGIRALTDATGMSARSLQRLADEGSIARAGRDQYSVMSLVKYLSSRKSISRDLASLRCEKLQAQVEGERLRNQMLEFDLKVRDGSLIEYDATSKALANTLTSCRNKLLLIPSKMALQLSGVSDPIEVQVLLANEITEALEELAQDFRENECDTKN